MPKNCETVGHTLVTNCCGRDSTGQHDGGEQPSLSWTETPLPGRSLTMQHGSTRSSNPTSTAPALARSPEEYGLVAYLCHESGTS
jgi:hypothetical protein